MSDSASGQFPDEQGADGSFERQEDAFRTVLLADSAEAGRYHLYICKACPWASRAWLTMRLMGLEDALTVGFADPIRDERGWAFREGEGHGPDEAEGFQFLAGAYQASDPGFKGRVTVPVLWDKQDKRIINNSEDDICRMWTTAFRHLAKHPVDLFPESTAAEQAELSEEIYEKVNNGVYLAGFAATQDAYIAGVQPLFDTLDTLDKRLEQNGPFLLGDEPVETDWRLFCTLIRFDAVYHGHFKCNLQRIIDYPALQSYMERLYQIPGVAETVDFDHIKRHYYVTHDDINPSQIVPLGPRKVIR